MEILRLVPKRRGHAAEAADRLHGTITTDEAAEFLKERAAWRAVMDEAAAR